MPNEAADMKIGGPSQRPVCLVLSRAVEGTSGASRGFDDDRRLAKPGLASVRSQAVARALADHIEHVVRNRDADGRCEQLIEDDSALQIGRKLAAIVVAEARETRASNDLRARLLSASDGAGLDPSQQGAQCLNLLG
jgi:hypothetical protein